MKDQFCSGDCKVEESYRKDCIAFKYVSLCIDFAVFRILKVLELT